MLNPRNTDALNNKGVAYAAMEKYEEFLCRDNYKESKVTLRVLYRSSA
jgi:hypothetical protein